MSDDCLFCRIATGDVPSTEVHSTPTTYAFRDIDAQAPSHVLVIPRRHITDADHLAPEHATDLADLLAAAQEVAGKEGLRPSQGGKGYRLVFNVGDHASNSVPHLHLHVIGGRQLGWPPG